MSRVRWLCCLLAATFGSALPASSPATAARLQTAAASRTSSTETSSTQKSIAQQADAEQADAPEADAPEADAPEADAQEAKARRRQQVSLIGIVALLGLLLIGLVLLAWTILWGRRIRRLARVPTSTTALDPLWYLRGQAGTRAAGSGPRDEQARSSKDTAPTDQDEPEDERPDDPRER